MKKTSKTQKRIDFINEMKEIMLKHKYFSGTISRKGINENEIQRNIFLDLNDDLKEIIPKYFPNIKSEEASEIIDKNFIFEGKLKSTLKNFPFFSVNHRADAELSIDGLRIAFEIKKGADGNSIRSGIGQSIVYASQYDFTLYFFVDITPGGDIKSSLSGTGQKENELTDSLWENYNILFFVV